MRRSSGITLVEVLVIMVILIFIILAFTKSTLDLFKYIKRTHIHNVAKELGEKIRSDIYKATYGDVSSCFNVSLRGYLDFESGNISFVDENFYSTNCPNCSLLSCNYCYIRNKLVKLGNNSTLCEQGFLINVGYNAGRVVDLNNDELGLVIGVIIYYEDPITKEEKSLKYLVYKEKL